MSWDIFDRRFKEPRVKASHLAMMRRLVERDRAYDAERDRLLDEPDLDAEQDRRDLERIRWGLAETEADE